MRGEWIEISTARIAHHGHIRSLPMRGEWIEIRFARNRYDSAVSLPMRGEWIEMVWWVSCSPPAAVSPHAGRVD